MVLTSKNDISWNQKKIKQNLGSIKVLDFIAPHFFLCYLGWKFEEEGQKNEVVGWKNPKMQELKDQKVDHRG
jgi:hypothetical protein